MISFWERDTWLHNIDFAIVGSGIVGLSCALELRERHPNAKIVVFEKGVLPSGASTKNAGFACFGSVSEILNDLKSHSEEEVINLISKRYKGLQKLRSRMGDTAFNYEQQGGYEVFLEKDSKLYEACITKLAYVNELAKSAISTKNDVFLTKNDPFSFKSTKKQLIFNPFEGQVHTGMMMAGLIKKCMETGIFILNSTEINSFSAENDQILLKTDVFDIILAKRLLIATNGFAKALLEEDVQPARAQVLITHPIPNLSVKGTFHLDAGYYYFRNIGNRILLGGGRNLDFKGETTTALETTDRIQHRLEQLLAEVILPTVNFAIDQRWSGIMGVGTQKNPIIKEVVPNVYCGIRLGGMGVAIGSLVGHELATIASNHD